MRLVLYQPDIPQNTGAIMRLAACFGVPLKVIEPCGFVFSDARLRRAGLDYTAKVVLTRHVSWDPYQGASERDPAVGQLVLLTTSGSTRLDAFRFLATTGSCSVLERPAYPGWFVMLPPAQSASRCMPERGRSM